MIGMNFSTASFRRGKMVRLIALVTCLVVCIYSSASLAGGLTKVVENDFFLFNVPSNMQEVEVQGVDSFVKQYESDSIKLSFDYGWYSNNFGGWPEDTAFEEVVIGGRSARVGTVKSEFRKGFPYATQIHFKLDDDIKLSMFAACETVVDVTIAHGIFETILFKKEPDKKLNSKAAGGAR